MNSEKEKKVVSRKRKIPLDTEALTIWNIRRELNGGEGRAPAKGPKKGCMQGKGGPENVKCKFRGVRQREWGSWVAEIREPAGWGTKNRRVWLGSFETADEAAHAYDEAAKAMYGEYARLNSVIPAPPTPSSVLSPLAETATPTTLDFREEQVILLSDDAMFGGEAWVGMEQGEEVKVEGVDEANFEACAGMEQSEVKVEGVDEANFEACAGMEQCEEVKGVEVVNLSSNEGEEEVIEVTRACYERLLYFEEEMKELDCYDNAIMFARETWPEIFGAKFDDDASSSCEGELCVDDEETNGLWSCFL